MGTLIADRLDKALRKALPAEHFAVPGKRKLPINDEHHTRLAWDMVDRTQDLTPEERSAARARILRRAEELGIDTSDWHKMKAMRLWAMALNIANDDHPNKMPFSGILTKLDEPSDFAPGSAIGRRIIVTREAAERALPSLLGMAVDFTPSFDGHDTQAKIGIITDAHIEGDALLISGFVYSADFPEIAANIKIMKSALGFSFEAQQILVDDPAADTLRITELTFTGAAILKKDKAAYQTTSIAASADKGIFEMNAEEMKQMLNNTLSEALKPLGERIGKIETSFEQAAIEAANLTKMAEPHARAVDGAGDGMEKAGIGGHPTLGHVATCHAMAGNMRAAAALSQVPHVFDRANASFPAYANALPAAYALGGLAPHDPSKAMRDSLDL